MSEILDRLLELDGGVVYAVVGAFVFAEVALLIGFVVPGETAAIVGGVLASLGHADLWPMAAVVVVAAALGDLTGYLVGRGLGDRIDDRPRSDRRRRRYEQTKSLIVRRGAVAVFVGRYIAFVRTLMPTLAGATRMRLRSFLLADIAAGLTWGVGNVLIGYAAGRSYKTVVSWLGAGTAVVVVVAVIIAFVVWRLRRRSAGSGPEARLDPPASPTDPGIAGAAERG